MILNNELKQVSIQLVDEKPLLSTEELNTPDKIVEALTSKIFSKLDREELCIINFDSAMHPINFNIASIGTINSALFHPREILKSSVLSNAANVIMLHNHPSGKLTPSDDDVKSTKQACKAYGLLGINLLDHIIVGGYNSSEFYSFSKEDMVDFNDKHFDDVILKPLSDKLIKSIDVVNKADELMFWHNHNSEEYEMTSDEAELLLDYEDMNKRAFIVDSNKLKFLDVETNSITECNMFNEIKELKDYIGNKLNDTKKSLKSTTDFVEYCNKVSQIDDLKVMTTIASELYSKAKPKNYTLINEASQSTLSKEETMNILDKFFGDCLRYWETTLGVDSDLSKEAYEHAIDEIPTNNPFKMKEEKLNEEWVDEFRQSRLMDCYGKNIPQNKGGIRR